MKNNFLPRDKYIQFIHMKKDGVATFSKKLSELIKQRGLSVSQTATRVGMNKTTLHNYCNGVVPRNLESLIKLADFFEISLDHLLNGNEFGGKDVPNILIGDYVVSIRPVKKNNGPA